MGAGSGRSRIGNLAGCAKTKEEENVGANVPLPYGSAARAFFGIAAVPTWFWQVSHEQDARAYIPP